MGKYEGEILVNTVLSAENWIAEEGSEPFHFNDSSIALRLVAYIRWRPPALSTQYRQ